MDGAKGIGAIEGVACGAGPTDIAEASGSGATGAALIGCDDIPGGGGIIWAAGACGTADGAGGAGGAPGVTGENCSCTGAISCTGTGVMSGDGLCDPISKSRIGGG